MPSQPLKLGVVASALVHDVRESAKLARTLGFRGIQFDAWSPAVAIPELSQSGRREFRHMLSSQDRELVGLRTDAGSTGFKPPADVDRILSRLTKVLEAAAGLASPLLCFDLGPLPEPPRTVQVKPKVNALNAGLLLLPETSAAPQETPAPAPPTPQELAFMSQVNAVMAEIGQLADRFSTVIAFRSELGSFAALAETLRVAGCPWFGLDLDPASVLRDEWTMEEIFSQLGTQIRHVRGRDAVRGTDRRTQPAAIGKGHTDWPALLSLLDAAAYHGWLTVDPIDLPDRPTAAAAAIKALERFV